MDIVYGDLAKIANWGENCKDTHNKKWAKFGQSWDRFSKQKLQMTDFACIITLHCYNWQFRWVQLQLAIICMHYCISPFPNGNGLLGIHSHIWLILYLTIYECTICNWQLSYWTIQLTTLEFIETNSNYCICHNWYCKVFVCSITMENNCRRYCNWNFLHEI